MNYKIQSIPIFEKQAKRLAKKYPSLKDDLRTLINQLQQNPILGKHIGNNCYKIRIAIKSKGKGKSGGARLITHFFVEKTTIYLLSIYDKSDKETISDKELLDLLQNIPHH